MKKIKEKLRKILPKEVIWFWYKLRAWTALLVYGFPARSLMVIGVTGTNGKTTTCELIHSILEEAKTKTALASTIHFKIGSAVKENLTKMTTISPFTLQKFLKEAKSKGAQAVVLEVTSHALEQERVWGIPFDIGLITNITREHLDYHQTMENYRRAKAKLFKNISQSLKKPGISKVSILNKDDESFTFFSEIPVPITYYYKVGGQPDNKAEIVAQKVIPKKSITIFQLTTPYGSIKINLPLIGKFNLENSLAAASVGVCLNIPLATIKKGLEKIKQVPGRLELVGEGQNFSVLIDYAHTPDALQKLFQAIKPIAEKRIISVLGAAGDRDRRKRPLMGAIAAKWADVVILTNEDPASEEPEQIIKEIEQGVGWASKNFLEKKNLFKFLDRKEAIGKAFELARRGDWVIISGKGAEKFIEVGDKKIPWDERKIVRETLKEVLDAQKRKIDFN